jgi:hypothetical protein
MMMRSKAAPRDSNYASASRRGPIYVSWQCLDGRRRRGRCSQPVLWKDSPANFENEQILSLRTAMLVFPIGPSATCHICSHPSVRVTSQVIANYVICVYCLSCMFFFCYCYIYLRGSIRMHRQLITFVSSIQELVSSSMHVDSER